ncbi:lytic transglycosylase domain-containing protein [Aggregatilinea lenta]|uniref:lytic transglycosylase domain-containing protein n=1 Tax=Aggregatilinea lenta TaxID=913108 RepID=UPI000E5C3DFE|nr:transglycosylase SLT domain-containing protein [Aggregatilinea lenta]
MATQTYERSDSLVSSLYDRLQSIVCAFVLLLCGAIGFAGTLGAAHILTPLAASTITYEIIEPQTPAYSAVAMGESAALTPLSSVFTPQVQYWAPLINAWAIAFQMDPNLIATVIQIESCGDPSVGSSAGAQGLFQVMPFHFAPGEDMLDVQTNAARGLNYLAGGLAKANGHVGLALAGYNGGHGVIDRGWATWPAETQRYYYWGSRIYSEATSGTGSSPTLQEWLTAGGGSLCTRAQATEDQLTQQQAGY